jgi:hypothetical protein
MGGIVTQVRTEVFGSNQLPEDLRERRTPGLEVETADFNQLFSRTLGGGIAASTSLRVR